MLQMVVLSKHGDQWEWQMKMGKGTTKAFLMEMGTVSAAYT